MKKFMVAAVQMDTQNDKAANWQQMGAFVTGTGRKKQEFRDAFFLKN